MSTQTAMRTIWDVLTSLDEGIAVAPDARPSHARVTLPNGWEVSLAAGPMAYTSKYLAYLEGPSLPTLLARAMDADITGRRGSPEGWFDTTPDAEVAIFRPDGAWYQCQVNPDGGETQVWSCVSADDVERLVQRVAAQPEGCLCPECNP